MTLNDFFSAFIISVSENWIEMAIRQSSVGGGMVGCVCVCVCIVHKLNQTISGM